MKKEVGLWIDRNRTVIVTLENDLEVTREIRSNIASLPRVTDAIHSKNPKNTGKSTAENMRIEGMGNHLRDYYTGVISMIRTADSIWIFGPGKAKGELEQMLTKSGLGERIVGIETVAKMTDPQIKASVRGYFKAY